jgi:hypothetical protein
MADPPKAGLATRVCCHRATRRVWMGVRRRPATPGLGWRRVPRSGSRRHTKRGPRAVEVSILGHAQRYSK